MKKIYTLAIFLMASFICNAQYVNIPDPEFRKTLQNYFPSCFNGSGMLDTTCTTLLSVDTLDGYMLSYGFPIYNLDGVQYFKGLKYLDVSVLQSSLSSIPALPSSLTYLNCNHSNIATLPALPSSLTYLNCNSCYNLTTLPALPAFLTYLDCNSCNNLTTLPTLPTSLTHLDCNNCSGLTSLPALPSSLTYYTKSGSKTLAFRRRL